MSTQAPEAAGKTKGNSPIYEEGDIAVFLKTITPKDQTKAPTEMYNVAVGPRGNRTYFEAYRTLPNGVAVEPADVVALYRNETLRFDVPSEKQPGTTYPIVVGGVMEEEKIPRKDGQGDFIATRMRFVTGKALRVDEKDPSSKVAAFLISEREYTPDELKLAKDKRPEIGKLKFWRSTGPKTNPVQLELADCFRLRNGERLSDGEREAFMEGIDVNKLKVKDEAKGTEVEKEFKTAKVTVKFIEQRRSQSSQQRAPQQAPARAGRSL